MLEAAVTSEPSVRAVPATPLRYERGGTTVTWGAGSDLVVQGFSVDGRAFGRSDSVSRIAFERGTGGEPSGCSVFAERLDDTGTRLAPSFASVAAEASAVCDVRRVLQSRTVNRGVLDLFANGGVRPGNVERADFIFNRGALAPFEADALDAAGHPVAERGGDSPVRMAAILALDASGRPSRFGPSVLIGAAGCPSDELCFVRTAFEQDLALLASPPGRPGDAPLPIGLDEDTLAIAFVSSRRLGLGAGQRYHGFSLFDADVLPGQADLTDPDRFPRDTTDAAAAAGGGLDLYGGLGGHFVANDLSGVIGTVFLDTDGNGVPGEGDAGVADIGMTLYRDADGDGVFDGERDTRLDDGIDTDTGGVVRFHALTDGTYFLVLDDADEDVPGGLVSAPGSNPRTLLIEGDDTEQAFFPLLAGDGGDGGDGGDRGDGGNPPDRDDSVTAAVPDSYSINQGTALDADVLDNDTDAAGQGLTIIARGESANADVSITGDTVSYVPEPDFVGTDSFTYTVQDGQGVQSTAAITVSVLRFSDINGNGLNDVEECAAVGIVCDDLTLETGVHGSGIGAGSPGWLLLLGPLAWGRRRSRRPGAEARS